MVFVLMLAVSFFTPTRVANAQLGFPCYVGTSAQGVYDKYGNCVQTSPMSVNVSTCYSVNGTFTFSGGVSVGPGSSWCPASTNWTQAYINSSAGQISLAPGAISYGPTHVQNGGGTGQPDGPYGLNISISSTDFSISLTAIYSGATPTSVTGATTVLNVLPVKLNSFTLKIPYNQTVANDIASKGSISVTIGSVTMIIPASALASNAPSNLTAIATSPTQVTLSWKDNSSGLADYFSIERSTSGGSFSEIKKVSKLVQSINDLDVVGGTSYQYRVRTSFSDGTFTGYSNVASVTMGCPSGSDTTSSQQLKAIYDRLPNQLIGSVSTPWYISALINVGSLVGLVGLDTPSDSIKKIISALALPGRSLSDSISLGMALLLNPGPDVQVGSSLSIKQISTKSRLKVVKYIKEAINDIGTKYGLNSNEINILFQGMVTNEAPFTINSFSYGGTFDLQHDEDSTSSFMRGTSR